MRFIYTLFFSILFPSALFAQVSDILYKLDHAANDSEKIAVYSRLIRYYSARNPDSCQYYANQGIEFSQKKNYLLGEAMIYAQQGRIDENQGRVALAKKRIFRALQLFQELNYLPGIADMNGDMGAIEAGKGNYDSASKYFILSLKQQENLKAYKGLMIACTNLGSLYLQLNDSANAGKYFFMAEDASKKIPLTDQTVSLYNSIGIFYDTYGNGKKALEYFLNDLKLSDTPGFVNSHIESLLYLGEYYIAAGDILKAQSYLEEGLRIATEKDIPEMQANILFSFAGIYKEKNPILAMQYLEKAKEICRNTGNKSFLITVYNQLIAVHKQLGNYKDALEIWGEKQKLTDSVFNLNKTKEIANITSAYEYETNKEIKELEALSKHNAAQRDIIILVAVCLIIALVIIVFYYRKTIRLNKQLVIHEKDLEELNSMKDKLFSVIGHDLRGPIARIPAIIDIYEDESTTPEERKFLLDNLKEHTKASLETFDKLLYWGQTLVKGISLHQTKMLSKGYIKEAIDLKKIKAAEKNISITDNTPTDITVFSDSSLFDFIIRNLLANALKYTFKDGTIDISVDLHSKPGFTVFAVKDSGIGIDKEMLPKLFYSLKSQRGTDNEKGHGIGLMLCKEFAVQNGGNIWVESEAGKGATFYFSVKNEP